jgi:hypothetical protein
MKNIVVALGMAMWVTACSTPHSEDLAFPTVQLPTAISDVAVATESDGHFIVHVGQVPLVLATDFVPG